MPSGLTGITGFVEADPFATAEQRSGGTADPRHAELGERATPYPWEQFPGESHGPYGIENEMLGMEAFSYFQSAGVLGQDPTADLQPLTTAAPWPRGIVQSPNGPEQGEKRQESADIHASNMGGSREALFIPTIQGQNDTWTELWEVDPGIVFPAQAPIPDQMKTGGSSGWGSRDRVQSFAGQNGYGFDSAHMHRRYATGSIPGNYQWMEPGSRPLVKSIPGTAIVPTGVDSPFYGQDTGFPFDPQGAVLMDLPTAYAPPPLPATAADYAGQDPADVAWF